MADLGCFLVYTFQNVFLPTLVSAHKINNADVGVKKEGEFENENNFANVIVNVKHKFQ